MQETSQRTLAQVSYGDGEPFDIDSPPRDPDNLGSTIAQLGLHSSERTSYEPNEEEIYNPKKKKVKKEKSSGSIARWFRKHRPFSCCCGGSSKFEDENVKVYDI